MLRGLGLMSGTSLDGIDVALIETDGEGATRAGPAITVPYERRLREALRACLTPATRPSDLGPIVKDLTRTHAAAIKVYCDKYSVNIYEIDVIGFHGQTIEHRPDLGRTWQIGDGALLASNMGRPVVSDFRSADVAAGGQGAPLVPLYHQALASGLEKPLAVLNIGGVANVTWLGHDDAILAFDTGPGNAPLDDWVLASTGAPFDRNGELASLGRPDRALVDRFLAHPFFARRPPKSLDRQDLPIRPAEGSLSDGAATILEGIAQSVVAALPHFPERPRRWLITGGGRRNLALMARLAQLLGRVEAVESVGWQGDFLEAQAFAYLAVRRLRGLPTSVPETTGCRSPTVGGTFWPAPSP
ncbi:MAG: anhydro-N-acetylmuramic acid kinase [Alphaproteobacteria bacterium]|nr:anhydro-N-acetylmuramic acid kinase [Alphaproteobacteria bacterium]